MVGMTDPFAFFCRNALVLPFLKNRVGIRGDFLELPFQKPKKGSASKLWEPESGTDDKQKSETHLSNFIFKPKVLEYKPSSHPV